MAQQILSAGLTGKLEQRTSLSLNQQRSLELLAMPIVALESQLQQELQNNPMLEIAEDFLPEVPQLSDRENAETESYDENDYERNSILSETWNDDLPLPGDGGADDEKRDFIGSLSAPPPALKNSLLEELAVLSLSEELHRAALEIIGSLDDDGYLSASLADLAMISEVDMSEMETALKIVQQISPAGVAARDLPECLQLQLERSGKMTAQFKRLLSEGISDLEKNRMTRLAAKIGVSLPELESMLKTLRSLNPVPGRSSSTIGSVIIPDLVINKGEDGEYHVTPRRSRTMRVTISPMYEKLLDDKSLSAEDRAFLTEKLAGAKELLASLDRRESTLVRLGKLLVAHQREFLDNGAEFLKTLTMKTAAAELEVSESTVSRTVDEKFVETPRGTYPLKYFFSAGYNTADGEDVSGQAVKEKIRQIVAAEDPRRPLSDDAIAQILKENGVPVARRTVAKYREAIGIASSSLRKKIF